MKPNTAEGASPSLKSPKTRGYGSRLAAVRGDVSRAAFARKLNINKNTLGNYESGTRVPHVNLLKRLYEQEEINLNWLVSGKGNMKRTDAVPIEARGRNISNDNVCWVPLYSQEVSAGFGRVADRELIEEYLPFSLTWMRRRLNSNLQNLIAVRAAGDSMDPTISDGDTLLADTIENIFPPLREGIYVVLDESDLKVKRLHLDRNVLVLGSDNKNYIPIHRELKDCQNTRIIGRVIWVDKNL